MHVGELKTLTAAGRKFGSVSIICPNLVFQSSACSSDSESFPHFPFPWPVDMFKRVEKRRRKKEEEEELGLDEDMKEVLGMQDTDSDESDSDSDSDSDSERALDAGNEEGGSDAGDNEEEGAEISSDEGDGDAEENEAKTPGLSVQDALDDPVYLMSLEPDVKACIVCPTKLLKHPKMIEVHKASNVCTSRLKLLVSNN